MAWILSLGQRSLRNGGFLLFLVAASSAAAKAEEVSGRFGFTGPEIFPIDNLISHLRAADLDGDGLQDLVVVNNSRSKINLLYNRTGQTNAPAQRKVRREINELPPDARFRIDSVASEKRIASLVVSDLNGDQRPDLAYYGEPKELVVHYNQGTNGWSAPKLWPVEGLLNPNALVAEDVNGDDLADLILLGDGYIYIWRQAEDHRLLDPQKIPYSGTLQAVQVLDIQGDAKLDLLLVNWDNPNPFRFRLQGQDGLLGPELHFTMPPVRSYWADDLDGDSKTELITIAQKSGRAQISHFVTEEAETLAGEWKRGQFKILPLNRTSKARRGAAWADMNKDGQLDLLVSEPDSGQLTLYLQGEGGAFTEARTFATLTGVSDLEVADWDGDGVAEVFLLSLDERQIGLSRLDEKIRLDFPRTLRVGGRPLVMTVGALTEGAAPSLVVITDKEGQRFLQVLDAKGESREEKLNEKFKSNPSFMALHDVDQDGLQDLVVLIPYERIKVLRQQTDGKFAELDVAPPGGMIEQPWLARADVDGDGKPELLLAQRNFIRAVVLQMNDEDEAAGSQGSFAVKEQINGLNSSSRIAAAAGIRRGTNQTASIFLLDAEHKSLTLCEPDAAGVWAVVKNVLLPETSFQRLLPVGIGSSDPNAVGFLGLNSVAWMMLEGDVWQIQELDGYETPIQDGFLTDVVSGDLDNDGRKDLVFIETAKSYLDLVAFEPPHQLVPANRWPVFEERTFRNRRNVRPEPREALVADLTGDGKNDLAVLVHDRILVYPQE